VEYEILNHGWDHSQYFSGCGVAFTNYTDVVTGIGDNAKEAYEDALEQMAMSGVSIDSMPKRPSGIRVRDKVPHDANVECYWFVSIRWKKEK